MSFLKGVLTGLAIGYLTAPRSGQETREKLMKTADDLQDQWEDGLNQVKSQVDRLTGKAEAKADQYADEAEQIFDKYKHDTQQTVAQKRDQTKTAYNNTVDELADKSKAGISNAEDALKLN